MRRRNALSESINKHLAYHSHHVGSESVMSDRSFIILAVLSLPKLHFSPERFLCPNWLCCVCCWKFRAAARRLSAAASLWPGKQPHSTPGCCPDETNHIPSHPFLARSLAVARAALVTAPSVPLHFIAFIVLPPTAIPNNFPSQRSGSPFQHRMTAAVAAVHPRPLTHPQPTLAETPNFAKRCATDRFPPFQLRALSSYSTFRRAPF
jgi:hypothetical protein